MSRSPFHRNRRIAPLAALVLLASACADRSPVANAGLAGARDSAGVTVVEHPAGPVDIWRVMDTTPVLEIGADTGVELFRVVAALRLADGRIFVAEGTPSRLLAFDARGTLLRTAGKPGSGPGEFQAIGWMQRLPGDSLLVHDPRLMRASVFTDSAVFVRTLSAEPPATGAGNRPEFVGVFGDRTLLATSRLMAAPDPAGGMVRPDQVLYRYDAAGAMPDSLVTVPGDESAVIQGIIARPSFARRTRIVADADGFFVAPGDRFEVSRYDAAGRLSRIARRDTPLVPVTDEDLAKFRLADQAGLRGVLTYPAVGALLPDAAGNLWVEEFRHTPGDESRWIVFDPDGRLLGAVVPVSGFRPLHVAEDLVLGVWQDELGVERVRLYRLQRPG